MRGEGEGTEGEGRGDRGGGAEEGRGGEEDKGEHLNNYCGLRSSSTMLLLATLDFFLWICIHDLV